MPATRPLPSPYETPVVTITEAAEILGLSAASAHRSVRSGLIPSVRVSDRRIVIPVAGLYELLGIPMPAHPDIAATA